MKARILWIEGKRANSPSFISALRKKEYQIEVAPTGGSALQMLLEFDPDLVVINASSLRTSGKRICRELREKLKELPIVLIVEAGPNPPEDSCANVVLKLPFTARKLLNRINPLLPADEEHLIHVGHFRLDLDRKKVRHQGKEARLTPRLTKLLQILLQHVGEVVERENLFRQVWNTEYIGDTRTLDVHISWLRQAIETDPRQPVYLKTIRGVGYRLDV